MTVIQIQKLFMAVIERSNYKYNFRELMVGENQY
jgi:hypothetical protein